MIDPLTMDERLILGKIDKILPVYEREVPEPDKANEPPPVDSKHFTLCSMNDNCFGVPTLSRSRVFTTFAFVQSTENIASLTVSHKDTPYMEDKKHPLMNVRRLALENKYNAEHGGEYVCTINNLINSSDQLYVRLWWRYGMIEEEHLNDWILWSDLFQGFNMDSVVTVWVWPAYSGTYVTPFGINYNSSKMTPERMHAVNHEYQYVSLKHFYGIKLLDQSPKLNKTRIGETLEKKTDSSTFPTGKDTIAWKLTAGQTPKWYLTDEFGS